VTFCQRVRTSQTLRKNWWNGSSDELRFLDSVARRDENITVFGYRPCMRATAAFQPDLYLSLRNVNLQHRPFSGGEGRIPTNEVLRRLCDPFDVAARVQSRAEGFYRHIVNVSADLPFHPSAFVPVRVTAVQTANHALCFPDRFTYRKRDPILWHHAEIPRSFSLLTVRHREFRLGLGSTLDALSATEANQVRNAHPLSFDILPQLGVRRPPLEFNAVMPEPSQVLADCASADSTNDDLTEKAGIRLERESRHVHPVLSMATRSTATNIPSIGRMRNRWVQGDPSFRAMSVQAPCYTPSPSGWFTHPLRIPPRPT